jgi:competence protein ComEC
MIWWWKEAPFLRLIIPLIVGIFYYHRLPVLPLIILLGLTTLGFITWHFLSTYRQFYLKVLPGLFFHLLLLVFGWGLMYAYDCRNETSWIGHQQWEHVPVMVKITTTPDGPKQHYADATILALKQTNNWQPVSGNIRLYFAESIYIPPQNSILIINKPIRVTENKPNKNGFNYGAYLALKNIYHQVILKQHQYRIIVVTQQKADIVTASRNYLVSIIDRTIPSKEENAMSKALLLGYRADIDKSLTAAYTNTGVVHVIAISGLHLGMIYGLLAMLFSALKKYPLLKWVRAVGIFLALWGFTLVCGATPSVVRSAVMFTGILLAELFSRENKTANGLASSAFLLLCYQPVMLFDIGFQLSYSAVGSLMLYNKSFGRLFVPENKILSFAWEAVSTSMAAQILTTPLVLYHFKQFPTLFILSNLIAVPLSSLVLLLLIIVCSCSWLPLMVIPLASTTSFFIRLMNTQVLRLSNISFGLIDHIAFDSRSLVYSYFLIAFLSGWMLYKKPFCLLISLGILLIWLLGFP